MFCEKCGACLDDDANFCERCGNKIVQNDIKTILKESKKTHKKIDKRIVLMTSLIVCIVVVFIFVMNTQKKDNSFKNVMVGDIVTFGTYEQDNNLNNGKEDIEWKVLDVKNGKALLISKYVLDSKAYHKNLEDVTWETCSLRKWLNSDFVSTAFTNKEQSMISITNVTADKNPEYDTSPGKETKDKVFLLSIDEINKYFKSNYDSACRATNFVIENDCRNDNGYCFWWSRSPGKNQDLVAIIDSSGGVYKSGFLVYYDYYGVRPALWLNLE